MKLFSWFHFWIFHCWCSVAKSCLTLCNPMNCRMPGTSVLYLISLRLHKLMSIESVMPSNHLIFCHPLLLLPSNFPGIRVFSKVSAFHTRWPNYRSLSISPSNEYSGLISFRIDWFDMLAVHCSCREIELIFVYWSCSLQPCWIHLLVIIFFCLVASLVFSLYKTMSFAKK